MTPAEIAVGQVLAGKGADADKTREVLSIDARRRDAVTNVYRDGVLVGERSTISLYALARWADRVITTKETNHAP